MSPDNSDNQQVLAHVYRETWGEIHRLREHEWRIAYYFVSFSIGIVALLASESLRPFLGAPVRWAIAAMQLLAMVFAVVYLETTHGHLTVQRNIRRRIEHVFGCYETRMFDDEPASLLPQQWKGKKVTHWFQRLEIVVPLEVTVVAVQVFSVYLLVVPMLHANAPTVPTRSASLHYVAIHVAAGDIAGVCISYADQKDVDSTIDALRTYEMAPLDQRRLSVAFQQQADGSYVAAITIVAFERAVGARAVHVPAELVERLRISLATFEYFVVLVGRDADAGLEMVPARQLHVLKRELQVNQDVIIGGSGAAVDWASLFR